ncbi:nicotinamide riboside transporter PnuC [Flavobacterium sp. DG1-102-2]|uniref:nicotinamide riboside transporter PnuC n=1 Tax=Flavobacterium sp. DG1-102-2 TaxID=3081663 RepID=UPI00294A811B|nr:nicotinamide riboside transporter PnuC [Flavobacterium sp. DG1-102-2]MDV6169010.1 nicotinamide riboside transporter PnuC [Flavobacterium sp. DG1-102-2]
MGEIFDFLFAQYKDYSTLHITLEAIATIFAVFSVIYSWKNNVLVYPTGLISTGIFVYLLLQWNLYGEMIINAYYFYMSIYGWTLWSKKDSTNHDVLKISAMNADDRVKSVIIFTLSVIGISAVYIYFDKFTSRLSYIDTFITGLFFVGMWLMAKRKIENWLFLIVGDIIAIPLFFIKGYTLTSLLNVILTVIAIFGYMSWKKTLLSEKQA